MNILVIEDELSIRQTLQDLLELNGHSVVVAPDGVSGIRLAADCPDLILCDIGLPDTDGYHVIDAVRRVPACADIPFIFLTARASRDDQRLGMSLGADDYITKPFTESEIVDAIAARVRRRLPIRERVEKLLTERLSSAGAKWSHELLSPLNGVLGGLELIEAEVETIQPQELKVLLGLIRVSAERQQDLSRKLLFHYELERKKGVDGPKKAFRCEARTAIVNAATSVARREDRTQDLSVQCETGELAILDGYLVAAISEVVENAFRFSKLGQVVEVKGAAQSCGYRIEVLDQGVGMTPDECAAIGAFTVFESGRSGRQGIGLGLSLARSVVEQAGGWFSLHPGPDNRGLQVVVELPFA